MGTGGSLRIVGAFEIDAVLLHNHYCSNDTSLLDLLPMAEANAEGVINGAPFSASLLTDQGLADWYPDIPTTSLSSANLDSVVRNVQ